MNTEQTLDTGHDTGARRPPSPSAARSLLLAAAFASFVLSVVLFFSGEEIDGIFVGIWVPSILSLGAFLVPR